MIVVSVNFFVDMFVCFSFGFLLVYKWKKI